MRRLLALATIYDGRTRSEAAQLGGVGLQTVRDWVLRFNAAGPDGLIDALPPGGVALLDDAQRQALADIVESGPIPASHGVVRWRLIDLARKTVCPLSDRGRPDAYTAVARGARVGRADLHRGGHIMEHSAEVFVGIDVAKLRNALALADEGRQGEVRYLGEFDADEATMRRIIKRLASKHEHVHFCYEAGPTGYGLHRLIQSMGYECMVVAPSCPSSEHLAQLVA